jgi:hypothetical protein
MPTDRQIAANRNNARKSTGPRSKEGKQASRSNALRHGLAIDIGGDPAFDKDTENLAKALSLSTGGQKVSEPAREAAEAQLDLMRIRKLRVWLFEKFADSGNPERLAELNDRLAKLARYDRRAFSRRKVALRAMAEYWQMKYTLTI